MFDLADGLLPFNSSTVDAMTSYTFCRSVGRAATSGRALTAAASHSKPCPPQDYTEQLLLTGGRLDWQHLPVVKCHRTWAVGIRTFNN